MLLNLLTTFISLSLLIACVLLSTALLGLKRPLDVIIVWGLAAFAQLVLEFQIANLLLRINDRGVVLGLQAALLLVMGIIWWRRGRPAVLPAFKPPPGWLNDRKNRPLLVLGGGLALVLALYLVLIYLVPPNNNDALQIHLARVLMWKQNGSYFPWETDRIWQITFPVNAQLVYLWTILFTQSDHFVALVPFLAGISCALLVFRLSRELGFTARPSALAGMVWLAFPVVQLHLTSVRHDLISTWLFLIALVYFIGWASHRQRAALWISAVALGLLVGTNFSSAIYLPGLVAMVAIFWAARRVNLRQILTWGSVSLLAFAILSSPLFISNTLHFGSPLGPDAGEMTARAITGEVSLGRYLAINAARWAYQYLDTSALPQPLWGWGIKVKALVAAAVSSGLNFPLEGDLATMNDHVFQFRKVYLLQEDEAWFGPLGWLLAFPTGLWALVIGLKQKRWLFLAAPIFLLSAFVAGTFVRPGWTPYDGRYFMPAAAISAAFLPLWFSVGKPRLKAVTAWLVVVFSLISIGMVVIVNPSKPVFGDHAVWGKPRIELLTRQSYNTKDTLYMVEESIPSDAVVGIATDHRNYQEYGVFGEDFGRKVIQVYPPEKIADGQWLADRGIEYLLILVSPDYPGDIAPGFQYVNSKRDWLICAARP